MRVLRPLSMAAFVALTAGLSGCGGPLYSACTTSADCGEGLRCVDLGNDQRVCTKPCTVEKSRAGYPDGFDNDELFVDGSSTSERVAEPQCAEKEVTVTSADNENEGAQNIAVESGGVVGVCRVSPEQLADPSISGDSILAGFCAPL